ncbi:uncharacterized protein [Typha latifolia]|uniref:uncharacterized protein isoform X2 n=1 Tax=Typha latifolia TaxID=4733 RepID=UPI003C2CAF1A
MAKYGEGDKRWIVEERPDGTNVHNWHWSERDCLEWSRSLLSSLLSGITVLDGEGGLVIRTKTVDKLEGEAYVNVRKGKVIPGYELSLSLSWEGEARSSADGEALLKISGTLEVPYLADENAGEDPEVRITVRDDDGPIGRRIKDAFIAKGKPIIFEKIRAYVQAMAKGGPAKDELEAKKPTSAAKAAALDAKTALTPSAPAKKEKKVKLSLDEQEAGVTVVKLTQTNVPEEDKYGNATVVENTERGWRELIFHKIRAVFGFGM